MPGLPHRLVIVSWSDSLSSSKLVIHGFNDGLRLLKQRRDRIRINLAVDLRLAKLRLEQLQMTHAKIEVRGSKCIARDAQLTEQGFRLAKVRRLHVGDQLIH